MRLCTIKNCGEKYLARGYCANHYKQAVYHGKIVAIHTKHRPAIIEGEIAKIPLGINAKDGYAIVDKEFAWLDKHKWSLSTGYAVGNIDGKTCVKMNRLIMGFPIDMEVDHRDMDRLNNTKNNLRVCTRTENMRNASHNRNSAVPYKGISISRCGFLSRIQVDKKQIFLGYFKTALEAAKAYDNAATELHGEFARLNNV
ncbi:MAG: HNH endonuclease [Proteobacteria bacterium]|jgi:hypothetical protein|nr:HNH endonuclease [Pseudomonadota bacterium]